MAARPPRPTPRPHASTTPAQPRIDAIAFAGATIRSGGVAVARIRGEWLDAGRVHCEVLSHGFLLDVLPNHIVQGRGTELVVAMRIYRRLGTPKPLCLVRLSVGGATSVASITVRV